MAMTNFDIDASGTITKPGKVLLFDVSGKQSWLAMQNVKKTFKYVW